jgi:hypothetical protein
MIVDYKARRLESGLQSNPGGLARIAPKACLIAAFSGTRLDE